MELTPEQSEKIVTVVVGAGATGLIGWLKSLRDAKKAEAAAAQKHREEVGTLLTTLETQMVHITKTTGQIHNFLIGEARIHIRKEDRES